MIVRLVLHCYFILHNLALIQECLEFNINYLALVVLLSWILKSIRIFIWSTLRGKNLLITIAPTKWIIVLIFSTGSLSKIGSLGIGSQGIYQLLWLIDKRLRNCAFFDEFCLRILVKLFLSTAVNFITFTWSIMSIPESPKEYSPLLMIISTLWMLLLIPFNFLCWLGWLLLRSWVIKFWTVAKTSFFTNWSVLSIDIDRNWLILEEIIIEFLFDLGLTKQIS